VKRAIVVGAGNMGRKWLRTVRDHGGIAPVALVDLDTDLAKRVADEAGLADLVVGSSLERVLATTTADVVIDATIPAAHREVTVAALRHGLAVLGEKPAAPTLAEAIALAALAEVTDGTFVVSQSRRFNPQLAAIHRWLRDGAAIGAVSARFSRGPRFGGFREQMDSPLIVDMAIHLFDMARSIVGRSPRAVYARETNPPWSWYRGDASAMAVIEFGGGVDFLFDGTWAGLGMDTSWNGDWRVSTDRGTIVWNGDEPAFVQAGTGEPVQTLPPLEGVGESLPGSLSAFVSSIESGVVADNEIHDNVRSLAIVEAVLASARSGGRVEIDAVLERARSEALSRAEEWGLPEIVSVLDRWSSVTAALDAVRPGAAVR